MKNIIAEQDDAVICNRRILTLPEVCVYAGWPQKHKPPACWFAPPLNCVGVKAQTHATPFSTCGQGILIKWNQMGYSIWIEMIIPIIRNTAYCISYWKDFVGAFTLSTVCEHECPWTRHLQQNNFLEIYPYTLRHFIEFRIFTTWIINFNSIFCFLIFNHSYDDADCWRLL